MEARDGSLESVSKNLSIRPHLFLECTVPLRERDRLGKSNHGNTYQELKELVLLLENRKFRCKGGIDLLDGAGRGQNVTS